MLFLTRKESTAITFLNMSRALFWFYRNILKDNPVDLKWKSSSGRETEFLYNIMFSRYTWMANLTTRFPVCKPKSTPKCLSRVEPDSSGPGSGSPKMNVTGESSTIQNAMLALQCALIRPSRLCRARKQVQAS